MRKLFMTTILLGLFMVCYAPNLNSVALIHPEPIRKVYTDQQKLQAIAWVETGNGGIGAYNRNEPLAVGTLQEWPILVEECNRILGSVTYKLEDREDDALAVEMFWIYQDFYNPTHDFEKMARIWCGGPDGMDHAGTISYYNLALNQLNTL